MFIIYSFLEIYMHIHVIRQYEKDHYKNISLTSFNLGIPKFMLRTKTIYTYKFFVCVLR